MTGSLLYFFATNIWVVLVARFITGIGGAIFLTCSVWIVRTTNEQERSAAFSGLQSVFMIGMILGPALNFPITKVPIIKFSFFEINQLNVVGLIMFVVMGIALIIVFLFFEEPDAVPETTVEMSLSEQLKAIFTFGTGSLVVAQFVAIFYQTCIETIITPVTEG